MRVFLITKRYLPLAVALGASLLLWGSYLAAWVSPSRCSWLGLLPIGYPMWVVVNLCVGLLLGLRRRREAALPLLSILLGLGCLRNYIGIHPPTPAAGLRVMSFNVKYFDRHRLHLETREARQERVEEFLRFIRESDPDIFCGQSFHSEDLHETRLWRTVRLRTGLNYHTRDFQDSVIYSIPPPQPGRTSLLKQHEFLLLGRYPIARQHHPGF